MTPAKNKIAIISSSLGVGGAERFAGVLSFILQDLGYEIHHIIVNDIVEYAHTGSVFNLGKFFVKESSLVKKIKKGMLLNRYLKEEKIEIIIDNRTRNLLVRELITHWIYGKRRIFYIVHSFHLDYYFPKSPFFAGIINTNVEKLICVSKSIENQIKKVYRFKNTTTIYNPIAKNHIIEDATVVNFEKYILYFGRIDDKVKNFQLLLEGYLDSKIYEKGYNLVIMGDGPDVYLVDDLIRKLELTSVVHRIPFQKNPFAYVKNARFTLLTSRFEGFPMSIIESLAIGTPVIAVDCNSGPAEIITNKHNGLIVENHNRKELAVAMVRFAEDEILYKYCKQNAKESVAHLSEEAIAKKWKSLLEKP